MIGAVIGDIVGSVYEWNNIKTKEFPLFQDKCFFTDDTVMTIAVAEGLMNGGEKDDFIDAMKKYGRMYPGAGYGGRFGSWLFSEDREPYHSWGNGSAMRTAAVGWWFDNLEETRRTAALAAGVTHDHPEGIKGAESTAAAIFLARTGHSKAEIRDYVEREFGYDLSQTLEDIRPAYRFNESCKDTVPQAIIAFLESADLEDAIRNAISLGGDSDTLAAITGSIAEAAYGVPRELKDKAWEYLDEPLRSVLRRWKKERDRMMTFICYPKCTTCQKARKWLDENQIAYEFRDIKTEHPACEELAEWHRRSGLPLKKFFNTSGLLYKSMGLKDKLSGMSEEDMLQLLAADGMLVKRPLLIGGDLVLVGFKEDEWESRLKL